MGLTLHWSLPTQVCNRATWGTSHPLPCTQDRPCVVNDYIRQKVGLIQRNRADVEEYTSKKNTVPEDS